jgi:hypothetical protein
MTPLLERLMILFPPTVASLLLVFIYAALMFGIVITIGSKPPDILYIDIPQSGLPE